MDNKNLVIVEQPYHILYKHSYGKISPYFAGLKEKKLLGTICRNKEHHKNKQDLLFLPPRADCPECLHEVNEWIELQDRDLRIYTFTTMYFSGESFLDKLPLTLINIDVLGFDNSYSKLTSVLMTDEKGEKNLDKKDIKIGMRIKPMFRDMEQIDASALYFVPK